MNAFAFQPSQTLRQKIQHISQSTTSTVSLELRNEIVHQLNDELIECLLTGLISQLREGEKKNIAAKLANYTKSTLHVLFSQILGKNSQQEIVQSIHYLQQMLYKKQDQQFVPCNCQIDDDFYLLIRLPADLVQGIYHNQAQLLNNQPIDSKHLAHCYAQFAEQLLNVLILDFQPYLNLGFIKRNATQLAVGATNKAIHLACQQIIPHLKLEDLQTFAGYYQPFFYMNDGESIA